MTNRIQEKQLRDELDRLSNIEGSGTELITVYIPPDGSLRNRIQELNQEHAEAGNIKSKDTRKRVQSAISKIVNILESYREVPENGLAVFSGYVESEGEYITEVIDSFPKQIPESTYHCDKQFYTDPLDKAVAADGDYILIILDKNDAVIGEVVGTSVKVVETFSSLVPGKSQAGGFCLAPDTKIVRDNGDIVDIEDIRIGDKIISTDFDSGDPITTVVNDKWRTQKKTFTIETQRPSFRIEASGDHTVFVHNKEGIVEKTVSDLDEEDSLVFHRNLPTNNTEEYMKLDIINGSTSLSITDEGKEFLRDKRQDKNLSQSELGELTGYHQASISSIEVKDRNVNQEKIENVCKALDIDAENFLETYCGTGLHDLPSELDRSLSEFIGFFMGDGYFDDARIRIAQSDRVDLKHYETLAKKLFGVVNIRYREDREYHILSVESKSARRFINSEFPEIDKSYNSTIPKKILESSDDVLGGFLSGLFDADGWASFGSNQVGIRLSNKSLINQIQLSLLRLGILSSLSVSHKEDNRDQYALKITDRDSLTIFENKIGFNIKYKSDQLNSIIEDLTHHVKSKKPSINGPDIRDILESNGYSKKDFHSSGMFLLGHRKTTEGNFSDKFIDSLDGDLSKRFQDMLDDSMLTAKIDTITKNEEKDVIDIETDCHNFIANGVTVHNSQQRFRRLREEAKENFFKEIAESVNNRYVEKRHDIDGIFIGAPEPTKTEFVNGEYLHHELQDKILAETSISTTTEAGLRQLLDECQGAIEDQEITRQREYCERFLSGLSDEDKHVTYGVEQTLTAIDYGAVDTLLVSENLPPNTEQRLHKETDDEDILQYLEESITEYGSDIVFISDDFEEGNQLREAFGGIAAILRYPIN